MNGLETGIQKQCMCCDKLSLINPCPDCRREMQLRESVSEDYRKFIANAATVLHRLWKDLKVNGYPNTGKGQRDQAKGVQASFKDLRTIQEDSSPPTDTQDVVDKES